MSIQDYTLVMSFVAVVVNGADDKNKVLGATHHDFCFAEVS